MKRMAGITIVLIVAFLLFAAVRLHQRRPRIEILHVDWLTKKVKFKMVAGKTEVAGILSSNGDGSGRGCGVYCLDHFWSDGNIALFLIKDKDNTIIQEVKVNFLLKRIERNTFGNPVPAWKAAFK